MAPEAPGNLIVLDLNFRKDALVSKIEQILPSQEPPPAGWLRVKFHEAPQPGFDAVGRGVAFVRRPAHFEHSVETKATEIPPIGKRRYAFTNVGQGEGLMLILVLPKGYTLDLDACQPLPRSAKEFRGRLAVYFKPPGGFGKSVTVAWGIRESAGGLKPEAERIRGEIVRIGTAPNNAGSLVDQEAAAVPAPPPTAPSTKPLSGLAYAVIALITGLIGIGLLLFYMYRVPQLVASGLQNQFFYILLIPWALACAGFLFGAMRSYARFTYRHMGSALELGGPVVLFCLVVAGGFKLVPAQPETFDLTVRAHSVDNPIITSGKITIDLDTDRRTASIDSAGEANFKAIPPRFRGATLRILPQVDGYEEQWQRHKLKGNVLDISLERAIRPVTLLTGSIIPPPAKGKAVKILVVGQKVEASPDEFGRFELNVNGKDGDRVRVEVYADRELVYDDYQVLPGPVTLKLHNPR